MSEIDAETLTHERFVLERRLGSGSTGTVYAAYDKKRDERVALKVLTYRSASALYRFKREFRTLVDVVHPHLVTFYELVADDEEEAFFTMELVEGVNVLDHVRPPKTDSGAPVVREDRLRDTVRQLAEAVKALHDRDKIHCDLKPNNVLVDATGRVVILDFGIARDLAPTLTPQSLYKGLSGTVPYMAPEQARGDQPRPASDWYAMGVILFQALTGHMPFEGSLVDVLSAKVSKRAPSPLELALDAPRDLAELCSDLLEIEPEKRPSGAEVLVRLGAAEAPDEKVDAGDAARPAKSELAVLGRGDALEALLDAFDTSRRGRTVAVYVHGESGLGKSALVRHFLWQLIETRGAVVLAGRCYEREHVPYKALDGVVDSLSRYLNQAGELEVPEDADALCLLFPVLRRVSFLEEALRGRVVSDRLSMRRRGFAALRRLLAAIAGEQPLVLFIDDLHWADADSTVLVHELLHAPEPFPLLLVASFRSEEIAAKPFLADLLREADDESARCREVRLGPLDAVSAAEMTRALLGEAAEIEPLVAAIVREAAGSPFFIEQLVDYSRATDSSLSSSIGLDELLDARFEQLPRGAEDLLRTLAAAGRPIETAVAFEAAGLAGDERPLFAALREANLVRTSGTADHVEIFHNRLRETLAGRIDEDETRRIHSRLAGALADRGDEDPEALFEHLLHAGETRRAAVAAARAAARARAALAFDRAARFFQRALDLGEFEVIERESLLEGLAECRGYAGHAVESAETYLELARVAASCPGGAAAVDGARLRALRYRHRAAEEYLAAGYFDEGLSVVREVGREVGLDLPASSKGALTSILWNRLRLRLRGLGFTRREAVEIPQEELLRVDACRIMATSLTLNWPLHGSYAQTRHLSLALEAGEPLRLSRALNLESSYRAASGVPHHRTASLRRTAWELARSVGDPRAEGTCLLHEGIAAYVGGRWREGAEGCEKAESFLKEKVAGGFLDIHLAQRSGLSCRFYLGDFDVLCRRVPDLMAEARERGNVLAVSELATRLHAVWLAGDDPGASREAIEEALAMRSSRDFQMPHYNALLGRCDADLYEGDGEKSLARFQEDWPRLERSLLMRLRLVAHEAHSLRGRVALAAAAVQPAKARLDLARRSAARLQRAREPYARPMAALLEAGLAWLAGDGERAARILGKAARDFEAQEMGLHATVARRRLGELLAGDEGRRIVEAADDWMRERKIARPERMAAVLAPGFSG